MLQMNKQNGRSKSCARCLSKKDFRKSSERHRANVLPMPNPLITFALPLTVMYRDSAGGDIALII